MSWADISIANALSFCAGGEFKVPVDKVPKLAALQDKVYKHPKIAKYIEKRPDSKL